MGLFLPRSRFLHVPKTAGTFTSRVLRQFFPHTEFKKHGRAQDVPNEAGLYTFLFTRHPLTWWLSVYTNRLKHHPMMVDLAALGKSRRIYSQIDECFSNDFCEFVNNILDKEIGHLWYTVYHLDPEINFIGRMEHLTEDVVFALKEAGETFDESALRHYMLRFERDRRKPWPYQSDQAERLFDQVADFAIHMGYSLSEARGLFH